MFWTLLIAGGIVTVLAGIASIWHWATAGFLAPIGLTNELDFPFGASPWLFVWAVGSVLYAVAWSVWGSDDFPAWLLAPSGIWTVLGQIIVFRAAPGITGVSLFVLIVAWGALVFTYLAIAWIVFWRPYPKVTVV